MIVILFNGVYFILTRFDILVEKYVTYGMKSMRDNMNTIKSMRICVEIYWSTILL